jgi:PIN domain nuclease of toxin-antitoxin system
MVDPDNQIFVSAVVAFELADLQKRGRIKMTETLDFLQANMEFEIAAFPADCWQSAAQLPAIHRDPVDRMLIAHALHDDMTLVTADAYIRKYPVKLIG